jgi:hypothetical protein
VVDARADQFAAGIVTWELLASQRYYEGLTPQQTWAQAGTGTYRAPELARAIPPELRALLDRALHPDRDARYASCREFRQALLGYARERKLHADPGDLRTLMGELFSDAGQSMRELLQRFAHISQKPRPGFVTPRTRSEGEPFKIARSTLSGMGAPPETMVVRERKTPRHASETGATATAMGAVPAPARRRWPLVVAAAVAGVALFGAGLVVSGGDPPPVVDVPVPVSVPVPPAPPEAPAPPPIASAPVEPEPASAPPAPKKNAPAKKKKPAFKARSTREKLDVLKGCRSKLTCAATLLREKESGLDLMSPAESMRFGYRVDDCYDLCVK